MHIHTRVPGYRVPVRMCIFVVKIVSNSSADFFFPWNTAQLQIPMRIPDTGTRVIRSGPQLRRICPRNCEKLPDERFYDPGDRFDPLQLGIGVGDRSGEVRVLADFGAFQFS